MATYLELRISVLRQALNLVVNELERAHGDRLLIDKDFFWAIPAEQRMNVYEQPADLTVGQISELLSGMDELVEDPARVTRVDAVKIAELLRTAGDALAS